MAAGHGDPVFQPHQFGQQFAARDHRDLQTPRFLNLGIRFVDGGTHHQRFRSHHIFRVVPFVNRRSQLRQAVGGRRQFQIRSGDRVTQIEQHFGNTAHADSADPREVEVLP